MASGTHRLAVLDGLRGIAILLVVWYHVWQMTWLRAPLDRLEFLPETGFSGVDLFFFLSGFVIAYPFLKAAAAGAAQPGWRHFAYRRFIKIVPSYVLSIALMVAFGYVHFASVGDALWHIGTHLAFIHTWFVSTAGSINGVLWSLAVEVQFYALFPLVWWCFRRNAVATAAAMIALALAWRIEAAACCFHTTMPLRLDNLPSYLDLFAAGMLSALTYVRLRERAVIARYAVAATLVALAGVVAFWLLSQNLLEGSRTDMWPYAWQVVNRTAWATSFYFIATGSLFGLRWWQAAIANPVLLVCGQISYNWYLYHQAVARGLLGVHVPPYSTANAVDDPRWQIAFTVIAFGVTALQAGVVTYLFERPLLKADPVELGRRFGLRLYARPAK
jgi:peptidoglycan/LPS O-acetylase OafA/YrhL